MIIILFIGIIEDTNASRPIHLGYVEFPPASMTNAKGKPDGLVVKIMEKVFKQTGHSWTAKSYPAKRIFHWNINHSRP